MQARKLDTLLLQEINKYLEEIREKYFRNTGRERAHEFVRRIPHLRERERLSDQQLAWRMLEYVSMGRGEGPLGTSADLRSHLTLALCAYAGVSIDAVEEKARDRHESIRQSQEHMLGHSGANVCTYTIPEARIDVACELLKEELTRKSQQQLRQPQSENAFVNQLINTINSYQDGLKSSFCGGIKFGRRTGFKRANVFRDHVTKQLRGVERLSDQQMLWRMYEYCKMVDGHGALGTSKELRSNIIKAMFDFLQLDMTPVYEHVNAMLCAASMDTTPGGSGAGLALALTVQSRYNEEMLDMIHEKLKQGKVQQLSAKQKEEDSNNNNNMRMN